MGADVRVHGGTADRPRPCSTPALAGVAAQQLRLCLNLHYQAAREAGIQSKDRHPDRVVGDRASLRGRAGDAPLHRALPRRRYRRDKAFQRFHDALAEHFGPEEILEIVGVVVNMNVWTRIKLAEGAKPGLASASRRWRCSSLSGDRGCCGTCGLALLLQSGDQGGIEGSGLKSAREWARGSGPAPSPAPSFHCGWWKSRLSPSRQPTFSARSGVA